MTARIEPAISAEQWANLHTGIDLPDGGSVWVDAEAPMPPLGAVFFGDGAEHVSVWPVAIPGAIAVLNAALPEDHRAKITREQIDNLRSMIGADETWTGTSEESFAQAEQFLKALESYLPPA